MTGEACSVCGAPAPQDPVARLAWSRDTDARGVPTRVCPDCTRDHVRAIEAKLDREWW